MFQRKAKNQLTLCLDMKIVLFVYYDFSLDKYTISLPVFHIMMYWWNLYTMPNCMILMVHTIFLVADAIVE